MGVTSKRDPGEDVVGEPGKHSSALPAISLRPAPGSWRQVANSRLCRQIVTPWPEYGCAILRAVDDSGDFVSYPSQRIT
jgi:hypothetical protein